jgi:hypothetical protein
LRRIFGALLLALSAALFVFGVIVIATPVVDFEPYFFPYLMAFGIWLLTPCLTLLAVSLLRKARRKSDY